MVVVGTGIPPTLFLLVVSTGLPPALFVLVVRIDCLLYCCW